MQQLCRVGQLHICSSPAVKSIVVLIAFRGAVQRVRQHDETKSDQKKHSFSYALSMPRG